MMKEVVWAEEEEVKYLIKTMESFTNGGLILIKEKHEDNQGYLLNPTSYLDVILHRINK